VGQKRSTVLTGALYRQEHCIDTNKKRSTVSSQKRSTVSTLTIHLLFIDITQYTSREGKWRGRNERREKEGGGERESERSNLGQSERARNRDRGRGRERVTKTGQSDKHMINTCTVCAGEKTTEKKRERKRDTDRGGGRRTDRGGN